MKPVLFAASMSAALLISGFATAQDDDANMNVGYAFGTNGGTIELAYGFSETIGTRLSVGANTSINRSGSYSGNTYDATLDLGGTGLIVDYSPFEGHFHLSAGLVSQNVGFELVGKVSNQTYNINGTNYSINNTLKSITSKVGFDRSLAPYYGLGWSNRNGADSGLSYGVELGVMHLGTASTSASANCDKTANAAFCSKLETDLDAEAAKISNDVSAIYPILTFGLGYRF